MMLALIAALTLQAAPADDAPPPAAAAPPAVPVATLFLYYRARYFFDEVAARRCERVQPARTRSLNARFEAARRRLVEGYRSSPDGPRSEPLKPDGPDADCRLGATLIGYENAVGELEAGMAATK